MMKRYVFAGSLLVILLSLLVGGAVMAYFTDEAAAGSSQAFEFGTVDIQVDGPTLENPGIVIPSQSSGSATWLIKNTGNNPVYLRAQVEPNYVEGDAAAEGMDEISESSSGSAQDVTFNGVAGWTLSGTGDEKYYYYDNPVQPDMGQGQDVVEFKLPFTVNKYWTGDYKLTLQVQAIQVSNGAIEEEWSHTPENKIVKKQKGFLLDL